MPPTGVRASSGGTTCGFFPFLHGGPDERMDVDALLFELRSLRFTKGLGTP
ncbi:hypothetical protein JKA73_36115 [Myxococcus xanthus]|uniref:hypothetical protein n=1 Tax=Myxococcus xanthus TaxID=34 RepID=UPI0019174AD9|nr:hypothetical protein [Myxococcus xanthus]QQR48520.1 hypothetical protein JKA73_36115 [Myxococcus xanthus]